MVVLDIETIANKNNNGYLSYKFASIQAPSNYKNQEAIDNYISKEKAKLFEKMALSPLTGRILTVGLLSDSPIPNADTVQIYDKQLHCIVAGLDGKDEKQIVEWTLDMLNDLYQDGHSLVTYNGKKFDIPYIIQRAIILGIKKPEHFPSFDQLCGKYNNRIHFDLFQMLNPNYGDFSTLKEWSYILGHTDSIQDGGNMVDSMFEEGRYEEIKEYNKQDLYKTYMLFESVKEYML